MSRRQAREAALQALFQLDLNGPDKEEQQAAYEALAVDTALAEAESPVLGEADRAYVQATVQGTRAHLAEIDELIAGYAKGWKLERMAAVDRNLTRLAIYEIRFAAEPLAPGIAINEAVELAKKYGTDKSSRYVNGILGALTKQAQ